MKGREKTYKAIAIAAVALFFIGGPFLLRYRAPVRQNGSEIGLLRPEDTARNVRRHRAAQRLAGQSLAGLEGQSGGAAARGADSTKSLSILFAGDLMQHTPQIVAAMQADSTYSYDDCFRHVAPLFRQTDIVVVNLETTLSGTPPYAGYPAFKAPAELAGAMKNAGMDVALLANNHVCDRGGAGIGSTAHILDSVGLLSTGAFADSAAYRRNHPLTIEKNGFRVTIFNYTYGTNGIPVPAGRIVNLIDTAVIARDMAAVERGRDHIVVACMHWGVEYRTRQLPEQDSLAALLHRLGADLVIGGHPHVVQPARVERDSAGCFERATVFSLGNFISNQRRPGTDGGMVVRFGFSRTGDAPLEVTAENFYVWTHRNTVKGRTKFAAIPSYAADSLLAADSASLVAYDAFIGPVRKTIGRSSGFAEMMPSVNSPADSVIGGKPDTLSVEQTAIAEE